MKQWIGQDRHIELSVLFVSTDGYLYEHRMRCRTYTSSTWSAVLLKLSQGNYWYHMWLLLTGYQKQQPIIKTCSAAE